MKKTYTNPEMNISVFMNENVVTDVSGTVTAAEYAKLNSDTIFANKQAQAILVF